MIEAPEARVIARQLSETVCGKTITEAVAQFSAHKFAFFHEGPRETEQLLRDRCVEEVRAIGGQVEMVLSGDVRFAFSDGCNVRYIEPGEKLPSKHQLLIGFDDHSALVFTIRMYGMMYVFRAGTFHNDYYRRAVEGINVYSEGFTKEDFLRLAADKSLRSNTVKALLATQQRIPGLGNGVLQDMLLEAKVHPKKKVGELLPKQREALYDAIRHVSDEMLRLGGRDSETDIFDRAGGYPVRLSARALGHPCPICGGTVERKAFLGGNIYYCTTCQPG